MEQIKIQTGKASIVLVELPDGATHFQIDEDGYFNYHYAKHDGNYGGMLDGVIGYELLGLSTELTEEQCEMIVDQEHWVIPPIELFKLLLTDNNVDPSKNWVVVIEKK